MCKVTSTRPAFVEAHPELREAHLSAQRAMFKAARDAKLSWSRDLQIRGMNEALGLKGEARIRSRRELTISEMKALTVAIEAELFEDDWTWGHEFTISIRRSVVLVKPFAVVIEEPHFEPIAGRFERMAANCTPVADWLKKEVAGI